METILVIIAVVLIIGLIAWFYTKSTVTKPVQTPHKPPTDNEWIQLLGDIETALAGIRTEKELQIMLAEFSNVIEKYVYHVTFMSRYTELINNWKQNH